MKDRQLSEKSLYNNFVKQRKRRSQDFANTIATRISYAIVRALDIQHSKRSRSDSDDVRMIGGVQAEEEKNFSQVPLGCDINFDERVSHKLKTTDCTITVKDYFPAAFAAMRNIYEIKYRYFKDSMSVLEGGSEGQGKSKQLFFFSHDKKYVIKTVKRHELQLMKDLIETYFYHHAANPDTMLCRFYGLYVRFFSFALGFPFFFFKIMLFHNTSSHIHTHQVQGTSQFRTIQFEFR